jgi:hypothetical protein
MRVSLSGRASARLLLAFGLAGVAAGCNSLLDVDNPATYAAEDLDDPAVVPVLVNGVISRFQSSFDDVALFGAVISDEAVSGNNFETVQRVDLRQIDKLNSTDVYPVLEYTRAAADSFEARLVRISPDTANRSLGLARVLAYGALNYTLMGEFLCEAPVDPKGAAVSPDSLFRLAIDRANRAIATATAFKVAGGAAVRADSLINFARVSAARAHLNLGERSQAIAFASPLYAASDSMPGTIPAGFQFRSFYDVTNSNNVFFGSAIGTNRNLGVDIAFRNLNDVRVRYNRAGGTGHDQATQLFAPYQSPSFSGFTSVGKPDSTGAAFTQGASIRISSALEARYIVAEAQGRTPENIRFLNVRSRAGQVDTTLVPRPPTAPQLAADASDAQYLSFLMDQRRRDFFLDGHRQGDLRRYIRLYSQNFYPTGTHPTANRGTYGTSVCFMPTQAEITGNPGYRP